MNALQLGATFAYLNAEYTEYRDVPAPFGTSILVPDATVLTPTIVNGVTIAAAGQRRLFVPGYNCGLVPGTGGAGQPAAAFGCDISGNKIPYSPEYSGAIFGSYDIDLGSAGKLTPYAALNFSGSFFGQPFNSILEKQKAFTKLDLRLTWAYNDNVSIQAYVTNVTNKATATRFCVGRWRRAASKLRASAALGRTSQLQILTPTHSSCKKGGASAPPFFVGFPGMRSIAVDATAEHSAANNDGNSHAERQES